MNDDDNRPGAVVAAGNGTVLVRDDAVVIEIPHFGYLEFSLREAEQIHAAIGMAIVHLRQHKKAISAVKIGP